MRVNIRMIFHSSVAIICIAQIHISLSFKPNSGLSIFPSRLNIQRLGNQLQHAMNQMQNSMIDDVVDIMDVADKCRCTISIRRYQPEDLPEVHQLFIDGMKVNGKAADVTDKYIQYSLSSDLSSIDETYLAGRGTFLVMVEQQPDDSESSTQSRIIGMIGMQDLSIMKKEQVTKDADADESQIGDGETKSKNVCELRRMSIHSSERRKGRGKQIVQSLLSRAQDAGFDGVVLTTGAWMDHAISFYLSIGFVEVARIPFVMESGKSMTIAKFEFMFD